MPVWAGRVVEGTTISSAVILMNLLALVLVPLVIGMVVRDRLGQSADRWRIILVKVANLALIVALVGGITENRSVIIDVLGSRTMIAALSIVAVAILAGMSIGGRDAGTRATIGLISG